jgi:hypothetical protein
MSGIFCVTRGLLLVAGGALGAVATLGLAKKVRPAAVGTVREGYALKEWVAGKFGRVKGEIDSLIDDAVREYRTKKEAGANTADVEKELLEKIDKLIQERLSRMPAEKGEEED